MSSQNPTIAFFGATGGVANSALVNALRGGAKVIALVRTPSKLTQQLKAQGISEAVLSSQLTILSGNAVDVAAIKSTLTANKPNYIVSHIITGLGAAPRYQKSLNPLKWVTIDQPKLCGDAAHALVDALTDIYAASPALAQQKPKLTFVSTTGISNGPEDVPCSMRFLYHQLLAVPHVDKREMESTFTKNSSLFSGVIGMRPTLLTGAVNADSGIGWQKIRVGREAAPVQGFTISRADVGQWMWVNVIGDAEKRKEWEDERISMTN